MRGNILQATNDTYKPKCDNWNVFFFFVGDAGMRIGFGYIERHWTGYFRMFFSTKSEFPMWWI